MKREDFEKTLLIHALTLSFLVHICVVLSTLVWVPSTELTSKPIEIEILSQNETNQKNRPKTFVTDPDETKDDQNLKNLKDQADLLSRLTRRVEKQQIAKNKDRTVNASGTQQTNKNSAKNNLQKMAREEIQNSNAFDPNSPSITKQPPPAITQSGPLGVGKGLVTGFSGASEYIPEIEEGGFTSLNTDQFVYYTYFARLNEQVRNRWVNNIRYAIQKEFTNRDLSILGRREQISEVEILLSREGHFISAIVHRKADDETLDNAATIAFRTAAPFLNPPSELIEEDGLIHLKYQFHVHFRPHHYAEQ